METFKILYFTDPLCCWSWAFEPQMRKLRYLLKDRLDLTYVMGGLLRDWKQYNDQLNDVARPTQLGPLWMQVRNISGQPINENIWISDPVDTSYLACMAVKAAGLQSKIAEEAMLRQLREAVMMHQKNIGELEVLLQVAEDLEKKEILRIDKFQQDLFSEEISELFKKDLDKTKASGISRFPSLLISYKGKTYQITGYHPFTELQKTFKLMDLGLNLDVSIDKDVYSDSWASLTKRELAEASQSSRPLCL